MQNPVTLSLFDYRPPQAAPRASEQDRQAARVGKGIDEDVLAVVAILAALLSGCAPEPRTELPPAQVVRVLDVTIKDSNVTGRRQRFVCSPVIEEVRK